MYSRCSADITMPKHWHSVMLPGLQANGLPQRGHFRDSWLHMYKNCVCQNVWTVNTSMKLSLRSPPTVSSIRPEKRKQTVTKVRISPKVPEKPDHPVIWSIYRYICPVLKICTFLCLTWSKDLRPLSPTLLPGYFFLAWCWDLYSGCRIQELHAHLQVLLQLIP